MVIRYNLAVTDTNQQNSWHLRGCDINRIIKRYPDLIQDITEENRKFIIMNAGIALIGLALVLLSVAFMVSPSTASVTGPTECGRDISCAEHTIPGYYCGSMIIPENTHEFNDCIISCPPYL